MTGRAVIAGILVAMLVGRAFGGEKAIEFVDIRKAMKEMTSVQWEEYTKNLQGKTITWTGWVEDVKKTFTGKYKCLVDMDPPTDQMSVYDVTFRLSESEAKGLKKDDKIRFKGTIKTVVRALESLAIDLDFAAILSTKE
ncbi:MAG: hypothetical protein FJ279_18440 [Planctomycetes bacterium]|nr:hypothetical protein [Planctomycetota bacterium]MBM4078422.1 hypothetical protein [Planctomycetota bacterium]